MGQVLLAKEDMLMGQFLLDILSYVVVSILGDVLKALLYHWLS